jgi:hypothetical protein
MDGMALCRCCQKIIEPAVYDSVKEKELTRSNSVGYFGNVLSPAINQTKPSQKIIT